MSLSTSLNKLPKWVLALGPAAATAVAGIWLNYSDFRNTRLEQNNQATERTVQANADLKPLLEKFIALANGTGTVSADDRAQLTRAIRQAYDKAEDVRNRVGGLDNEFNLLGRALVALKEGADKMTGPLDGKQFVLAYSRYVVADENWRKEVQRRQNSYVASFRF